MQFFQDQVQYLLDVLEGCFRRLSLGRRPYTDYFFPLTCTRVK